MDNDNQPNHSIPIYLTLTDQASEYIRAGIHEGRWQEKLPAEAELCREMGISRGTLRRALKTLFDEGELIPGGRGGRHTFSSAPSAAPPPQKEKPVTGNIIRILSPQSRFIQTELTQLICQTMSERLGRAGFHLEFEHHPGLWKLRRPAAALKKITSQPNTAGWVLLRSTKHVQKWFESSGIPTVVVGGIYPDIRLPHAEFDLTAASRHAAGVFSSRNYTRMVFLSVDKCTAGDRASAAAFFEAAASLGAYGELAVFDDTIPGLCRTLDGLLLSNPPPNAFFVAFPNHVPATIGHLTRRGFPVPQKVSVISRLDALLLAESIPSVARYSMDAENLGRAAARMLLQMINSPSKPKAISHFVMPEFEDGETAGKRPTS